MKIEPFLITSSLSTVAAQRLVRRLCTGCQKETKLPDTVKEEIEKQIALIPEETIKKRLGKKPSEWKFYEAEGCTRCENTGYKGRILIDEIMEMDDEMRNVIVSNPTIDAIRETAKKQNMLSMFQDGILKALERKTSISEVIRATRE